MQRRSDAAGLQPDPDDSEHTPPYDWSEIEENLAKAASAPRPRCARPMRWIYFRSDDQTWELGCGRAGWTPICRKCRTWRACRVEIMS